jgi:hypothetical protein
VAKIHGAIAKILSDLKLARLRLRFQKVDSVFRLVRFASSRVEFEFKGTLLAHSEQGID